MGGRRGQKGREFAGYCGGRGSKGGVGGGVDLAGVEGGSPGAGRRWGRHGGTVGDDGGVKAGSEGVEGPGGFEVSKGTEVGVIPEDALEGPDVDDTGGRRQQGYRCRANFGGKSTHASLRIFRAHPARAGLEAAGLV